MRNAWHFYYALTLVVKVVCGGFGIALLTPLTGRYVNGAHIENISRRKW
ncbi:DUF3265 domain-containing protein [Vibrio parahaemolyticus]|nr:DUF3265 domain-containing protein [Vibrio parahaemolyticus]